MTIRFAATFLLVAALAMPAAHAQDRYELVRVTNVAGWFYGAVASPDGRRIAFYGDVDGDGIDGYEVYTANPDGSGRTLVARDAGRPLFSPNGSQLAFMSFNPQALHVVTLDGSAPIRLTPSNVSVGEYAFSPDGSSLVLSGYDGGFAKTFVVRTDGTGFRRISPSWWRDNAQGPAYAPDGRVITMGPGNLDGSSNNVAYGVWMIDPMTLETTQVIDGTRFYFAQSFNFAPGGKTVYFRAFEVPTFMSDMYSLSFETGAIANLTNDPNQQKSYLSLSPDGLRMLYQDYPALEVTRTDTLETVVAVAPGPEEWEYLDIASGTPQAWLADGSGFLFSSARGSDSTTQYASLYVARLAGSAPPTPEEVLQTLAGDIASSAIAGDLGDSLGSKIRAAQASLGRGNTISAKNQLEALANAISAQLGKRIPTALGEDWLRRIRSLL